MLFGVDCPGFSWQALACQAEAVRLDRLGCFGRSGPESQLARPSNQKQTKDSNKAQPSESLLEAG